MKKSRFTETQIIGILNEGDAGMKVKDICPNTGYPMPLITTGKPNTAE